MNHSAENLYWIEKLYAPDATADDVMRFYQDCKVCCLYCQSGDVESGHFNGYDRKCGTCGAEFWLLPRGSRLTYRILDILNKA